VGEDKWPDLRSIHTVVFDFDGVFTNNKVYLNQNGDESVRCDRADGLGLNFLNYYCSRNKLKIGQLILSKEKNPVVLARANKLNIECKHGVSDKKQFLTRYFKNREPNNDLFSGLVYLGNDLNDLPMIKVAGFSVVPNDAHPIVKRYASVVLHSNGGDGFVREFIEKLMCIDDMSTEELDELICNC